MFETIKNAWKLPDLKKRICFTLLIIVVFRFGAALPVPFLDASVMQGFGDGNLLGFLNMLTGGAFQNATLFALSISPYITASIVVQLLAVAIPALEQMSKEGAEGRKRLNKISRYVTIALALIQSYAYYRMLDSRGAVMDGGNTFGNVLICLTIVAMFTAGAMICVWLGEQIDDRGIGNGISMILFAGIVSRGSSVVVMMWQYLVLGYENLVAGATAALPDRRSSAGSYLCYPDRLHRSDDQGGAQNPDPVCKTCCRPQNVWRTVQLHSGQRQHVWRYADHLCKLPDGNPWNNRGFHSAGRGKLLGKLFADL